MPTRITMATRPDGEGQVVIEVEEELKKLRPYLRNDGPYVQATSRGAEVLLNPAWIIQAEAL